MSYTAEDFAKARFAVHGGHGRAMRLGGGIVEPYWRVGAHQTVTDEDMAREGWVPVVEATEVMLNRQVDAEAHLDQIARLSRSAVEAEDRAAIAEEARRDTQAAVDDLRKELAALRKTAEKQNDVIKFQRETIKDLQDAAFEGDQARRNLEHDLALVDLRQENDRLERIIQAPLSLRDLEVAWENAEQADECNAGDVLIMQDPCEGYSVWRTGGGDYLSGVTRILTRTPQREPWQDLEDVMRGLPGVNGRYSEEIARKMHDAGVRVVGGEEA